MKWKFCSQMMAIFAVLTVGLALVPGAWAGGKKQVLYGFKGGNDGKYPTYPGLIFDKAGNLYGTTFDGGKHGFGTAFELKVNSEGGWTEVVLHSFAGGLDGADPSAGLVFDEAGNLYGITTFGGGLGSCSIQGTSGCGTVFELKPKGNGQWAETILLRFDGASHGGNPTANVTLDSAGNLYGVAALGTGCGGGGCGMVFELIPTTKGLWKEQILYSFSGPDGAAPQGPLIFDGKGILYGTTISGGSADEGAVFELEPTQSGPWKEILLHSFTPQNYDGSRPCGRLALDAAGNLYGSTQNGGRYSCNGQGCGMVYELAGGTWDETVLFNFRGRHFKGISNDEQGVAFDSAGNLYGTAAGTGLFPGGIFELIPQRGGWKEHLIYGFAADVFPGMALYGADGNLYGMSYFGGANNLGVAFRITP